MATFDGDHTTDWVTAVGRIGAIRVRTTIPTAESEVRSRARRSTRTCSDVTGIGVHGVRAAGAHGGHRPRRGDRQVGRQRQRRVLRQRISDPRLPGSPGSNPARAPSGRDERVHPGPHRRSEDRHLCSSSVPPAGPEPAHREGAPVTFSQGGPGVDLVAPGERILSTSINRFDYDPNTTQIQSASGAFYERMSGTSQATPHVAARGRLPPIVLLVERAADRRGDPSGHDHGAVRRNSRPDGTAARHVEGHRVRSAWPNGARRPERRVGRRQRTGAAHDQRRCWSRPRVGTHRLAECPSRSTTRATRMRRST